MFQLYLYYLAPASKTQPGSLTQGLEYYNVRIQKRFTKSPEKELSGEFLGRQRALREKRAREFLKKQQSLKRAHQVRQFEYKDSYTRYTCFASTAKESSPMSV